MPNNVTLLGNVADDFDSQLREAERVLDQYVESRHFSTGSMIGASTAIAFMRFGQSFVDMLRLGNGLKQGGWRGVGTDTMRLLTATGVAGAAVSRLSRILVLTQQAGTYSCTWVTTANALRQTGQRFFASMDQLAQAAGVDLSAVTKTGTTAQQLKDLIEALKKMGIAVEEIKAPTSKLDVITDLLKTRGGGALAFGIEYQSGGRTFFHRLFATYSNLGGLAITDTTGVVYRSFGALLNAYANANVSSMPLYFLKNTAIISSAENAAAAGGLSHLVVELLPLVLKNSDTRPAPIRRK